MKKIDISTPTHPNIFTIVDDADYEALSCHKWYVDEQPHTYYAGRSVGPRRKRRRISMHRLLMDAPDGMDVDHRDGNGLNNQRHNLRVCTRAENLQNSQPRQSTSSKFKGVSWKKASKKWQAQIQCDKKKVHLGLFPNETEAARMYDAKAKELFGEFARLNFPEGASNE